MVTPSAMEEPTAAPVEVGRLADVVVARVQPVLSGAGRAVLQPERRPPVCRHLDAAAPDPEEKGAARTMYAESIDNAFTRP